MAAKLSPSEIEARVVSGAAWDDFCDQLKALGQQITRPETPTDPFNRARAFAI